MTAPTRFHRRETDVGGALLVLGSVQFVASMAWVGSQFPRYSLTANYVSDLGNPTLSPWAWMFDLSVGCLGLFAVLASALLGAAFPGRPSARIGRAGLGVAGIGALLVGIFPENSTELGGHVHFLASALAFVGAALALLFLALAMFEDERWRFAALYTLLSGLVTLLAIGGFLTISTSSDVGAWERVVLAPVLLWSTVAGVRVLRLPSLPRPTPR
jgi:hypothetical membrane protein